MSVDSGPVVGIVPRLADGVELIGEYQGSGFREPPFIVRRADGQVIQLPRLLYLLAAALDGQRDQAQVAGVLSVELGKVVQAEQVAFLVGKGCARRGSSRPIQAMNRRRRSRR